MNIIDQVRQARATYQQAHEAAETAAVAFLDVNETYKTLKLYAETHAQGSNDKQRAAAAIQTLETEHSDLLARYEAAQRDKVSTAQHLERCERNLNTLRDELNHEAAEINLRAADRQYEAQERAAETAEKYRQMPGNHTMATELRARWPVPADFDNDPNDPPF